MPKKKKIKGKAKENNGTGKKKQGKQTIAGGSSQDNDADKHDEFSGGRETKDERNEESGEDFPVIGTGMESDLDQANDTKDEGDDKNRPKVGTKSVTIVEDDEGKAATKTKKGKKKGRKSPPTGNVDYIV